MGRVTQHSDSEHYFLPIFMVKIDFVEPGFRSSDWNDPSDLTFSTFFT